MAILIQISDFKGKYAISTGKSTVELQELIDSVETKSINELLGTTYATTFLADASANNGVPVIPANLAIYNPVLLDGCYSENYSTGIKDLLKYLVYFYYYTDVQDVPTSQGLKNVQSSVSKGATISGLRMSSIYNDAINNHKVIQNYICKNSSDYPDAEGIDKNFKSAF